MKIYYLDFPHRSCRPQLFLCRRPPLCRMQVSIVMIILLLMIILIILLLKIIIIITIITIIILILKMIIFSTRCQACPQSSQGRLGQASDRPLNPPLVFVIDTTKSVKPDKDSIFNLTGKVTDLISDQYPDIISSQFHESYYNQHPIITSTPIAIHIIFINIVYSIRSSYDRR